MRYLRYVLVLVVVVCSTAVFNVAPVLATVDAGPWDVYVVHSWSNGGLGNDFYVGGKVSVDSDDDGSNYYRLCYSITRASPAFGPVTESTALLAASDGMLEAAPTVKMSGTGSSTYTLNSAWVVRNSPDANSTCNSGTKLPIRSKSNELTVRADHIEDDGNTSTPTSSTPLASGVGAELPSPPTPAGACSRTLGSLGSDYHGTFRIVLDEPAPSGATDAFGWDFGDSSTDAATAVAQHSYGDLSTMPANGWTATGTVTRTGDGVTYDDDPAVVLTCTLRVDFRNPDQSDAGGVDPDDEDADCPAGFGWLNPLAIVKVLKCLFVPTSAGEDADAFSTALDGSIFGIVTIPIGILSDAWGRLWSHAAETALDCDGPDLELNFGLDGQAGDLTVNPMAACDPPLSTVAGIVKALLAASVYIGGALACLRILAGAMGWRTGFGSVHDKGGDD